MLYAYRREGSRLVCLPPDGDIATAAWIDLFAPQTAQIAAVTALGVDVPTLEDMEEIEISNRLYTEDHIDYMTVVLPGQSPEREHISGPVTFILKPDRVVTVRYHNPRPFETFPERADRASAGCATPDRIFLGLLEEIVSRQADLLEGAGKVLDTVARKVYAHETGRDTDNLRGSLKEVGRQGELLGRVQISLLSLERAASYFVLMRDQRKSDAKLKLLAKGVMRDINALEVHGEYLNGRVSLIADSTLGMINLEQAATVRIVSVVAVIFLPPTVIASAYGMNFDRMPELDWAFGYPMALGMMLASAVFTYLFFKWKGML